MKRRCTVFFLFFVICTFQVFAQQMLIEGTVRDSATKEPLSFVNVYVKSGASGTVTDEKGNFKLHIPAGTEFFYASSVGYARKRVEIEGRTKYLVYLTSNDIELGVVNIKPGLNPADAIMEEASARRHLNDPEKRRSFTCKTYNKFSVGVTEPDVSPELRKTLDDTLLDKTWLFLSETISEKSFLFPDQKKEKVVASRTSGLRTVPFALLATQLQSFSFYGDVIEIMGKRYLGPLASGNTSKYLFVLEDSVWGQGTKSYMISYRPQKNKNFDGLKGFVYVDSENFALTSLTATPFFEQEQVDIKISQEFDKLPDGLYFPRGYTAAFVYKKTNINLADTGKPVYSHLKGSAHSVIYDLRVDSSVSRRVFRGNEFQFDRKALNSSDSFWAGNRLYDLSARDSFTYRLIDSLGNAYKLDSKIKTMELLMRGKVRWGKIDFDIDRFLSINRYEGYRTGAGFHTNEKLSEVFSLGGYYGYGFKDKGHKYGYDATVNVFKPGEVKLQFSYSKDVLESGILQYAFNKDIPMENVRNFYVQVMDKVRRKEVLFSFRSMKYLQTQFGFNETMKSVTTDYRFGEFLKNSFEFTALTAGIRYAYKEKYRDVLGVKQPVASKFPVVWATFTRGIRLNGSETPEFSKLNFKVDQVVRFKTAGRTFLRMEGGFVDADIPYSELFNGKANYSKTGLALAARASFETMGMNEFLSDRFVSLFMVHDFGKFLSGKKKFSPEISVGNSVLFGQLKNPQVHHNFPFEVPEKGFFESGLYINKLISGPLSNLGVAFFYRYGAYHRADLKENLFLKLTTSYNF